MPALTTANLTAYVLQIAAVIAIGAGLPVVLGVTSPRARLFYWRTLLVVCLVLPLIQPLAPAPAPPVMPAATPPVSVVATAQNAGSAAFTPAAPEPAPPAPWPPGRIVAAVLVAGIVARMAWLAIGLATLARLRRRAAPLVPRPPAVDEACLLTGTDAEFRVAGTVARPVTFGALRPVVVVPGGFVTFDERQQVAVACHELVHVRRRDWLRTIGDEIVRSVFWFHPALWWLIEQIRLTAEQLVDQEVVAITGARQPYLEALVRLAAPAPRMSLRPAALFIRRSHLRERVTLLLKEVSMSRSRLVVSFVTMAVALIVSGRLVVSAFPLQGTAPAPEPQPARISQPESIPAPAVQPQPVAEPQPGPAAARQASQAPKPQGSVRPGEAVPQPKEPATPQSGFKKIYDVRPVYPPEAEAAGIAGPVVLTITIDAAGLVADAKVVKGDVTLAPAALDAVRQWRYQRPTTAPVMTTVAVNVAPARQATPAPEAVRIGGDIKAPTKIKNVSPVYPEVAQKARVQGVVIAEATIGPTGHVVDARILRSIPLLDAAALDALMQWEFTPTLLNGVPVSVIMTVTVNFRLDSTPKTTGVEGGVVGGVTGGGVQGGVVGGVPGGVSGGIVGGVPTAPSDAPVRVGGTIGPPSRMKYVAPIYPEDAKAAGIQGVVIVEAVVGRDGKVESTKVLRSIPMLDQAAIDAVRQWEFTPTLLNGVPVPVIMTMTVNFTLQ